MAWARASSGVRGWRERGFSRVLQVAIGQVKHKVAIISVEILLFAASYWIILRCPTSSVGELLLKFWK